MICNSRTPLTLLDALYEEPLVFAYSNSKRSESQPIKHDILQNESQLLIIADLAGYKKDQVQIDLDGQTLTIEAKRDSNVAQDSEWKYSRQALPTWSKSQFQLPDHISTQDVAAAFEDGLLKLTLNKRNIETKKTIQIQ